MPLFETPFPPINYPPEFQRPETFLPGMRPDIPPFRIVRSTWRDISGLSNWILSVRMGLPATTYQSSGSIFCTIVCWNSLLFFFNLIFSRKRIFFSFLPIASMSVILKRDWKGTTRSFYLNRRDVFSSFFPNKEKLEMNISEMYRLEILEFSNMAGFIRKV